MKELNWDQLDFKLNTNKDRVRVYDHSGASCGENRREYLGSIPIYAVLEKDMMIAWLKHVERNNKKLFKETLAQIVKEFS